MMPVYVALLAPSVYSGLLAQSTAVSGYDLASIGAALPGAALLGACDPAGGAADAVLGLGVVFPAQAPKTIAETASSAIRAERPGARDMLHIPPLRPRPACSLPCRITGSSTHGQTAVAGDCAGSLARWRARVSCGSMQRVANVALAQIAPTLGALEANLDRHHATARRGAGGRGGPGRLPRARA